MSSQPIIATISAFAGSFIPVNYIACDGRLLSIADYQVLYTIIGTTFGGDGVQTFAVPNLQGRSPVGAGTGPSLSTIVLGQMSGAESATLNSSTMPPHTHTVACDATGASSPNPSGNYFGNAGAAPAAAYYSPTGGSLMNAGVVATTGQASPAGFSIRNPCLAVTYIICAFGIFPSQN